jgi:Cdc6-like AAA superfamily ATPase
MIPANLALGYQYNTHYPSGIVKEIKHWLSPENVLNDDYITRRGDRLERSFEWAYGIDVIRDWLRCSPDSRTASLGSKPPVLVTGKAGSGKSVLAAHLHHNLAERFRNENWSADDASRCSGSAETEDCQDYTVTENKAVLYFPVSNSTKPASIIRTLIDQLLQFQPTNSGLQNIVRSKLHQRNVKECTSEVGIEILVRLLRTFPSVQ